MKSESDFFSEARVIDSGRLIEHMTMVVCNELKMYGFLHQIEGRVSSKTSLMT